MSFKQSHTGVHEFITVNSSLYSLLFLGFLIFILHLPEGFRVFFSYMTRICCVRSNWMSGFSKCIGTILQLTLRSSWNLSGLPPSSMVASSCLPCVFCCPAESRLSISWYSSSVSVTLCICLVCVSVVLHLEAKRLCFLHLLHIFLFSIHVVSHRMNSSLLLSVLPPGPL